LGAGGRGGGGFDRKRSRSARPHATTATAPTTLRVESHLGRSRSARLALCLVAVAAPPSCPCASLDLSCSSSGSMRRSDSPAPGERRRTPALVLELQGVPPSSVAAATREAPPARASGRARQDRDDRHTAAQGSICLHPDEIGGVVEEVAPRAGVEPITPMRTRVTLARADSPSSIFLDEVGTWVYSNRRITPVAGKAARGDREGHAA